MESLKKRVQDMHRLRKKQDAEIGGKTKFDQGEIDHVEDVFNQEIYRIENKISEIYRLFPGANKLERDSLFRSLDMWGGKAIAEMKRLLSWMKGGKTAGKISDAEIERARRVPVADFLPEKPKKNKIHCLVHTEKTPSMHVYRNNVHCFGCGVSMDVIDVVQYVKGIDFVQAVKLLNGK